MDVESENYDAPPSTAQASQQQQMHCDHQPNLMMGPSNNGPSSEFSQFPPANETAASTSAFMPMELPVQTAIPLPAPPLTTSTTTNNTITANAAAIQPPASEFDIDSLLLQQFSCMGTTDHDDLISQFQSLMNNQMNKDSARFFLEMSNWNLQTAVGCYLDFCNFQTLPSMKIVECANGNVQQQAWRLQNDGTEDWPSGCYLMSPSQLRRVEVPMLRPGSTCDISAEVPPNQPAVMWRLCTPNGWYFGETIWMIPPGSSDTAAELTERMSQLRTTTAIRPENFPQMNVVITVNME